jgi:hypothetical protein
VTDKDELAALKARIEDLERKANPPEPPKFDGGPRGPTTTELAMSRMAMPPQAMRVMIECVDDAAMAGIRRDGRAPQNLAPLAAEGRSSPRLPQGMREPTPLSNPPGIALADRIMDAADRAEREERILAEARRRAAIKAATEPAKGE